MSLIDKKEEEYKRHCLFALEFYNRNDYEHALGDFRKSAEALMKIIILKHFGEINGDKIINGELDNTLSTITPPIRVEFQGLLDIVKSIKELTGREFIRLIDLQKKTNPSAHNPNSLHDFKHYAELCKSQSFELTNVLYKKIRKSVPSELSLAYSGQINPALISALKASDWDDLISDLDGFSKQNTYILVAPPKFEDCSPSQLEVLSRINWSFIVDFDHDSKDSGLYKALNKTIGSGIIPLTIAQKGQKDIVGPGSYGSVNWLFANGLSTIPQSITTSIKDWRKIKYHIFLKELFRDFFSKTVRRYIVIYLWDDLNYIEEITRAISEIDAVSSDLVTHIYISKDADTRGRIDDFDKFDIRFKSYDLSANAIISEVSNSLDKKDNETDKIFVPGRTKSGDQTIVDISDVYSKLLDNHISVVYQNIEQNTEIPIDNEIPPFYQGEQITWKDLSVDIEVRRNRYDDLLSKVKSHLQNTKKSLKFELFHKPGAGGTTLAHRVAFDLKSDFPTIVISGFDKSKTYKSLSVFLDKVNRPVLAIVEASNIGINDIEDMIRACNGNKLVVCFLYVRRTLKINKSGEFSSYVNDLMTDVGERDRFLEKAKIYAKSRQTITDLSNRTATECEVIDFSLAINESGYNNDKLIGYLRAYIEKMSENQVRFTAFVCIIYYYSQKSVSEYIFRSLFKKSLFEELRSVTFSEQYIRKILIQEYDQASDVYSEYWRPRFSKFAETVMTIVLGGGRIEDWKDQIGMYSTELIKIIKANNEYLVDETRSILKSVFFERNNEDLLGTDEQWRSNVDNEQFSFLLRDIGVKQEQKSVLLALVNAYPSESHFLGHLARFLYEKAEENAEFIEAEEYILRALDCHDGDGDFNLQHLGGMCKRRQIEFLKRNFVKGQSMSNSDTNLISLSDEANEYFNKSREINPYNIHAYVAQIQTLILAIDFGREISGIERKEVFITSSDYTWYLEQYHTVKRLIDEAQILIEQQETLGRTSRIEKAKYYVASSEGRSFELLGNYGTSIEMFKNLIEKADRNYRPQLRLMYIHSTLMNKVKGDAKRINEAWYKLKTDEISNIEKSLNDNILQDPSNILTLRLWFKLVRHSQITIRTEEIIARLKVWYDNSENSKILNLEAAYYLYVLNACLTIKAGDSFSNIHLKETVEYINKCRELSNSSKFTFEWYGKEKGIACLINHKDKPFGDDSMLERVEGVISVISSRQQGKIILKSGLEAFFVPTAGGFVQARDETSAVSFYLGFRHDGLFAIDVRSVSEPNRENQGGKEQHDVADNLIGNEQLEEIVAIEEIEEVLPEITSENKNKLSGLKIVGKVDLSKFNKKKGNQR